MSEQKQAKEQAAVNEQVEDKNNKTFFIILLKTRRNKRQMMDMMKSLNKICELPKSG